MSKQFVVVNSFASSRAIRGQTWLAGILILFVLSKRICGGGLFGILEKI
jgi:hypothetical protein